MSKLPHIGTTIFTVMSKLAKDHEAINLSQGFPNFPVDEALVDILREQSLQDVHQYMPMGGSPVLLTEVAALIERSYGRQIRPEQELLITAGATQALFTAIMALVNAGDEVVILDPAYDSYAPSVILAGGIPVHVSLKDDFLPDWDRINDAITSKTRMLITNNPHNPSGRIWSAGDISALENLMQRHDNLLLLSDEVYEFITFDAPHQSVHAIPALRDRSVIVSSFGKTFHITGWKIGYMVAPEHLMTEIKKVHQFNVFCVNSVAQASLAQYLAVKDVRDPGTFYREKRDLFRRLMEDSRFRLLPCEGTYFQTADYSEISRSGDVEFCRELTTVHGVAAIPVSVFRADRQDAHIIRFCFAKDDETLLQATRLLCKI